jgi:chromosome segregation ATPase
MAITEQTYLYEVMLRFGPEGLTGAHQRGLTRLVDEAGNVLMEREGAPEALTPDALAGLMTAQTADLLAQLDAMVEADAALRLDLANTQAALTEAQSRAQTDASGYVAQLAAIAAEVNGLQTTLAARNIQIAELQAQLAAAAGGSIQ